MCKLLESCPINARIRYKEEWVSVKHAERVLEEFGIVEEKPRGRRHLVYEELDAQSVRVLNRMVEKAGT